MKKFISMVMAAAMVVSLVPATAFAANEASFKVVDDYEVTEAHAADTITGPEVQIKLNDVDAKAGTNGETWEVTLKVDGAYWNVDVAEGTDVGDVVRPADGMAKVGDVTVKKAVAKADEPTKLVLTVKEDGTQNLSEKDVISIPLGSLVFEKQKAGAEATIKVTGDFGSSDEMVFAAIVDKGITAELDDEVVDVAVEEVAPLEVIVVEPSAGDNFGDVVKATGTTKMTLKLSKGFEFANTDVKVDANVPNGTDLDDYKLTTAVIDDNEIELTLGPTLQAADKIEFVNLVIEATTADAGDVATLTVKMDGADSVKLEVAQVVDYKVIMSVDEDEDVPTFYSGVNVANDGLTVDDDHKSLEVTIKESFAGAWGHHKAFTLSLPEGVYVTAVDAGDENGDGYWSKQDNIAKDFTEAYIEGDHVSFEFDKRVWNETNPDDTACDDPHEITFTLTLVADPGFVGDVVLTLEADNIDTQEVVIAKALAPMVVKAEQNDLKIDYRYTEVPTDIVVTEAEAGLWDEKLVVGFAVERGDMIQFEDDAVFTVNEESEMEIEDKTTTAIIDDEEVSVVQFEVEESSDEEAAVVTISDISLFMQRNIPAGPYDLDMFYGVKTTNGLTGKYDSIQLLGQTAVNGAARCDHSDCDTHTIDDVCDYSTTVKEAWINVVTAGREADDASFTTKVVVPVGEAYIIAGETQVALDVPAYVNAAGYTMLPVRAVAVALGINTQNVLWDQATKTVTILYGQRIITMQVGAKVVYVNGSAIPASASVEIVDGRTFLPMRDLATALGVTDITWDAATKTATLNGNA